VQRGRRGTAYRPIRAMPTQRVHTRHRAVAGVIPTRTITTAMAVVMAAQAISNPAIRHHNGLTKARAVRTSSRVISNPASLHISRRAAVLVSLATVPHRVVASQAAAAVVVAQVAVVAVAHVRHTRLDLVKKNPTILTIVGFFRFVCTTSSRAVKRRNLHAL